MQAGIRLSDRKSLLFHGNAHLCDTVMMRQLRRGNPHFRHASDRSYPDISPLFFPLFSDPEKFRFFLQSPLVFSVLLSIVKMKFNVKHIQKKS